MASDEVRGGECVECRFCCEWQCRRYPPELVRHARDLDGYYHPPEWDFRPARSRCGEFKPKEAADGK